MQARVWTAALVVASVWTVSAHVATAQGLPGDFVGPYRDALDAMKQAYSQATIEGTVTTAYPPSGKSIARQFILRLSGNTSRIDAKVTAQKGMGRK